MTGFTVQWAVRTPSGRLYHAPGEKQTIDQDAHGWYRDMMGLFGGFSLFYDNSANGQAAVSQPKPVIFDTKEDAEKKLAELREQAAKVGVDNYGGAIVSRLCSPFTDSPAPTQFAERVAEWLESQAQQ